MKNAWLNDPGQAARLAEDLHLVPRGGSRPELHQLHGRALHGNGRATRIPNPNAFGGTMALILISNAWSP